MSIMEGRHHLYGTLFLLGMFTSSLGSQRPNGSIAHFYEELLSREGYDAKIRPGIDSGEPIVVYINLFIISVSSIDEFNMEYTLNLYLRQSWRDERLVYKGQHAEDITLNYNDFSKLWVPDTFFRNVKEGKFHDITVPNRLMRISPDGSILFSQRLTLKLDCSMHLSSFPMDNQTCLVHIGSYGYTTRDLVLTWKSITEPVELKKGLTLPEFSLQGVDNKNCTAEYNLTGSFACIYAEFRFKRRFEFHLIQTYVPSTLIVMLSWVSFWIDTDAVPARISLGLLTVLTITTMAAGISTRLPRVSYVKAIDVWMAVCLIFVFGALIEYSAVNVLSRRKKSRIRKELSIYDDELPSPFLRKMRMLVTENGSKTWPADEDKQSETYLASNEGGSGEKQDRPETLDYANQGSGSSLRRRKKNINSQSSMSSVNSRRWLRKVKEDKGLLVDVISRVLFPGSFFVFNMFYWIYYVMMYHQSV